MRNRFLILVLPAFLSGCIAAGPLRIVPTELMQECPAPVVDLTTNKGLSDGLVDYHEALKQCNLDKKGLRTWATSD